MSFNSDFERAFIQRSLQLVRQYDGPYDATLLLNCLLGLLIVPKETCIEAIPDTPIQSLDGWGIAPSVVINFGDTNNPNSDPKTLRGLVWRLRNAVAHFRFRPYPTRGEVEGFDFHDASGFKAKIPLEQLKTFVERLSAMLDEM